MYSAAFGGYNRLDTEISFGEALAKATSEIQKASGTPAHTSSLAERFVHGVLTGAGSKHDQATCARR